jgi:hypothetical protein
MGLPCGKDIPMLVKGQILVCGYYDRNNYGDEEFIKVLAQSWKMHNLIFKNLESVRPEDVSSADLIVLGGGDLLQEYFLRQVEKYLLPYKKCPLYAVGVSMPYGSALANGRLDMIDEFWCRFHSDVELLRTRFGTERVHHIPDLALLSSIPVRRTNRGRKRVGLCLSMSLVAGPHKTFLVTQIRNLIERLLVMGHEVNWLAFNNDKSEKESDVALYNLLPPTIRHKVILYQGGRLIPALVQMDTLISSRFHAHVFGSLAEVPTVSLVLTRKVEQWNRDHNSDRMSVHMPRKCEYCAFGSDGPCQGCESFMGYLLSLPINEITNKVRMNIRIPYNNPRDIATLTTSLARIAKGDWNPRITPPYFMSNGLVDEYVKELHDLWSEFCCDKRSADFVASAICLKLTGNINHPFHYGLSQGLKSQGTKFNLKGALDHMIRKYYAEEMQWDRSLKSHDDGLFALNKIPQTRLDGSHRSGWKHVVNLLSELHKDGAPILDSFIDKTFGWHSEYLEALNIIPYRESWVGFLHHPAKAVFSKNDCKHLIQKQSFIDSLPQCKALFVMATDLKEWLIEAGITVPIHVVYHPTENQVPVFKWKKFLSNPKPQIVQIGAWLRDPYAIFQLHVTTLRKTVLKCRDMVGYLSVGPAKAVPDSEECHRRGSRCRDDGCRDDGCRDDGCRDGDDEEPAPTPFVQSVQDMLNKQWASVHISEHLDNEKYDHLLSENIVLIPLLRAVAVNTVLECIVRNTPMIVKRLPAVVEYLGQDYPLYYETYAEAESKIADRDLLHKGYKYLKAMDKDFLMSEYFLESVRNALSGN